MYYRWMQCSLFQDKCHHKDEVSGLGITGNHLFKGIVQPFYHVDHYLCNTVSVWLLSECLLVMDHLLYVLCVYAGRIYHIGFICTDHVVERCQEVYRVNHANAHVFFSDSLELSL